ncbi:EAL domain-containing protein [Ramlibacter sp. H39-3-26]|uniref:bifunctional diguanylate cyclase/phosphodiesterase n=1 Tax=Curvibacter soli TaxID=3031331 RepID=UPI0023DADF38|nr:EAL domain-containing protein [Ramlibacter sp. H39-3-26]MDF1485250.1 EAL domain-containing protein [Ramlibacter sp. H39-3-26]
MPYRNLPTLQRRLGEWLLLGVLFLALGALVVHIVLLEQSRIARQELDRLQAQARTVDDNLTRQFHGIYGALGDVRDEFGLGDPASAGPQASARLQALVRAMPGVRTMLVVDAEGRIWAASRSELLQRNVDEREFFTTPREQPRAALLYVSQPFHTDLGVYSINVARVILDARQRFAGIVSATLDQTYVDVVLRSVLYAPDMHASIMHGDGAVFLALSGDSQRPMAMEPGGPLFARHMTSGQIATAYEDTRETANARMLAQRTINPASAPMDKPLVVGISRQVDAVLAPWRAQAMVYGVLYAACALLAVLGLLLIQRWRAQRVLLDARRDADRRADAERLELTLTGADVGLWDWDVPSGRMFFNERWYAMLGYAASEIAPFVRNWLALVHPEDRARINQRLDPHLRGETPVYECEYRMRHQDGHWVWILDRGKLMERGTRGEPVRIVGAHMDITARKHADEALRASEARFRSLTELSSDWYWEIDAQYRLVRIEGYSARDTGLSSQGQLGHTQWEIGALNMSDADWQAHRAALEAHETFHDLELQRLDGQGSTYWIAISGAPIFDEAGALRGYRGIGRDITGRKRAEDEIERLAFYDALTGLPNRRLLLDRLTVALAASGPRQDQGALLFIDLDNFKDLNDTMGHDVGDTLLERVANRLVTCVRAGDTVARLGGDEFVVMLEHLGRDIDAAEAAARAVAAKVLDILNHPYVLDGYQHHSTPSIGIALFDSQTRSVDELLKRADLAMYQAKADGRNTICLFLPEMQAAVSARSALEGDLRQSLQHDEMLLYYQPVVNEDAHLTGVEALLRWHHPQRGMVSPAEFIPLAEQTGLILPIGQWVLEMACAQLAAWAQQADTRGLSIAVNVSARQFRHPDFVRQVTGALGRSGASPQRLKLEITETLLLSSVEDIVAKLAQLKAVGVGFSLDDFGTGYSSLAYLKRLPLDQLKIDQSFVRDVLTDPNDAAIVRTILALAESLDLQVVAEGVEVAGQLDYLRRHGCKAFQGYLFGRPVPVEELVITPAMRGVRIDAII